MADVLVYLFARYQLHYESKCLCFLHIIDHFPIWNCQCVDKNGAQSMVEDLQSNTYLIEHFEHSVNHGHLVVFSRWGTVLLLGSACSSEDLVLFYGVFLHGCVVIAPTYFTKVSKKEVKNLKNKD